MRLLLNTLGIVLAAIVTSTIWPAPEQRWVTWLVAVAWLFGLVWYQENALDEAADKAAAGRSAIAVRDRVIEYAEQDLHEAEALLDRVVELCKVNMSPLLQKAVDCMSRRTRRKHAVEWMRGFMGE